MVVMRGRAGIIPTCAAFSMQTMHNGGAISAAAAQAPTGVGTQGRLYRAGVCNNAGQQESSVKVRWPWSSPGR